jgi:hypothetical protein
MPCTVDLRSPSFAAMLRTLLPAACNSLILSRLAITRGLPNVFSSSLQPGCNSFADDVSLDASPLPYEYFSITSYGPGLIPTEPINSSLAFQLKVNSTFVCLKTPCPAEPTNIDLFQSFTQRFCSVSTPSSRAVSAHPRLPRHSVCCCT